MKFSIELTFVFLAVIVVTHYTSTALHVHQTSKVTQNITKQGAVVTQHCTYEGYAFCIDVAYSCGNERFDDELRLHVFKRHGMLHRKIMNDQLLTYRNEQLWYDAYTPPRCIRINNSKFFHLSRDASECTSFELVPQGGDKFFIQDSTTNLCAGLGGDTCGDQLIPGGSECGLLKGGGAYEDTVYHALQLKMGSCSYALKFEFVLQALECANGYNQTAPDKCFCCWS